MSTEPFVIPGVRWIYFILVLFVGPVACFIFTTSSSKDVFS